MTDQRQNEVDQDGFPWHDPGLKDLGVLAVVIIVLSTLSFVHDVMEAFNDAR